MGLVAPSLAATPATRPNMIVIRADNALLEKLPAPPLAREGAPNERKSPEEKTAKRRKKNV